MPFMVIYRHADGSSGYEQVTAIDEAAHFVERLRNDESIDQIRLFRMEEISFAFRPYYKVELGTPERVPGEGRVAGTTPAPHREAPPPAPGEPTTNRHADGGARLGLFQR